MNQPESHVDHFTSQDRERLVEVTVEMKHLKENLSGIRDLLQDHSTEVRSELLEHEKRITILEKFHYYLIGAAAVLSIAAGFLLTVLGKKLFGV